MNKSWHLEIGNKNREEIISAGKMLFFKNTLFNVKITDICMQAGVSRVTFYKYFKSMDELIFEVQMNILNAMKQFITSKSDSKVNGKESLKTVLYALIEFAQKYKEEMKFITSFDLYYCSYKISEELKLTYKDFIKEDYNGSLIKGALNKGIEDGSLREDLNPLKTGAFIHQTIMGLLQRISCTDFTLEFDKLAFDEIVIEAIEMILKEIASSKNK